MTLDCRRCDPWAHPNASFCAGCRADDDLAMEAVYDQAQARESDVDRAEIEALLGPHRTGCSLSHIPLMFASCSCGLPPMKNGVVKR